jgi:hypothetical protein
MKKLFQLISIAAWLSLNMKRVRENTFYLHAVCYRINKHKNLIAHTREKLCCSLREIARINEKICEAIMRFPSSFKLNFSFKHLRSYTHELNVRERESECVVDVTKTKRRSDMLL